MIVPFVPQWIFHEAAAALSSGFRTLGQPE